MTVCDESTSSRGFFAVDQATWWRACSIGLGAAASAFLVLARGTGADHRHTAWSADAVERRTGISWRRAKAAIALLQQAGLIECVRPGTRPMYRVAASETPTWIWLPNTLVDGVAGAATSALERVRQVGDVMLLRLLVDLYAVHHLREDGGIARNIVFQEWARVDVGAQGPYRVFGFKPLLEHVYWENPITHPHIEPATKKNKKSRAGHFFRRVHQLVALGLLEWVPTLWEHGGHDAEILHPVYFDSSIEVEQQLAIVSDCAARCLITEGQHEWAETEGCTIFVAVPAHLVTSR